MAVNVQINIDEDITRVIKKIKRAPFANLTLLVPKDALLFSDPVNLKVLKKNALAAQKRVSILTMDPRGQRLALEAGFDLRSYDALKTRGPNLDMVAQKSEEYVEPEVGEETEQEPESHIFVPTVVEQPRYEQTTTNVSAPVGDRKEASFVSAKKAKDGGVGAYRKPLAVFLTGLVACAVLYGLLVPKADVTLYARTQAVSKDYTLTLNTSLDRADQGNLSFPAVIYSEEKTFTKQYNASGKVDVGAHAKGQVQVYNFSGNPLRLNAATTKFVVGSKTYHLESDIVQVKPTRTFGQSKNVDPSSLGPAVEIVADQAGEDSNVPAGNHVEVENQVFGSRPKVLYAVVSSSIEGGTSRFSSAITQTDLDNAKNDLHTGLLSSIADQLYKDKSLVLLDSGARVENEIMSFDKKVNDQSLNFQGTIKAKITALVFDRKPIKENLEKRYMDETKTDQAFVQGKTFLDEKFVFADLDKGTGVLSVNMKGLLQDNVHTERFVKALKGRSAPDAEKYLESDPAVEKVEIKVRPVWFNNLPNLVGNINFTILPDISQESQG